MKELYERGSNIYLDSATGTYLFGNPTEDYFANKTYYQNILNLGYDSEYLNNYSIVARIHSHGADDRYNIDEQFSRDDIKNWTQSHPQYVVTPSGRLLYRERGAKISSGNNERAFPGYVVVGSNSGIYMDMYSTEERVYLN